MSKFFADVVGGLIGVAFVVLFVILAASLNGYVFATLWRWYLVPAFGVQEISVLTSIGIAILVGMLQHGKEKDKDTAWEQLLKVFLRPVLALAIGWMFLVVLG